MKKLQAKVVLWSDGSYLREYGVFGGSYLIQITDLDGNPLISPESGEAMPTEIINNVAGHDTYGSWNVTGEIHAVLLGLYTLVELEKICEIKELILRFDYEGIEHWIAGKKWGRKRPIAKLYYNTAAAFLLAHNTEFIWTKGHSGIEEHDRVDALAYEAAHAFVKQSNIKPDYMQVDASSIKKKDEIPQKPFEETIFKSDIELPFNYAGINGGKC